MIPFDKQSEEIMGDQQRLPLEQTLLGFLTQGPMHGYDLHRRAREEMGRIWHMGISNIYGALKRLEQAGHVESSLSPQDNRPPRKVYRITRTGRQSFRDWVKQPVPTIRQLRVEFLAKLYFLRMLGLPGVTELIAAQEAICRERIERFERDAAECEPQDFDRLVFDFRRRQVEAILDWLKVRRKDLAP
jgi:PadR family transcriptional regulator AphA